MKGATLFFSKGAGTDGSEGDGGGDRVRDRHAARDDARGAGGQGRRGDFRPSSCFAKRTRHRARWRSVEPSARVRFGKGAGAAHQSAPGRRVAAIDPLQRIF